MRTVRGVVDGIRIRVRTDSGHDRASSRSASGSPDTTVDRGPFTAATDSRSPNGTSHSRTVGDVLLHRHHPAPARKRLQRAAAQRNNLRRILKRQNPGDCRGSNLTLRMTHHRIRHHTRRLPHRRQRHHHRPQRRLHDISSFKPMPAGENVIQLPLHVRSKRLGTLGQAAPRTPATPAPAHVPSRPTDCPAPGTRTPCDRCRRKPPSP